MESKPISENKPELYDVSALRLDNLNYRLPSEVESDTQIELLMYMEEQFNLLPIARSMSDNGYFDEEPVIIIPKEGETGVFIVVEGNRRLAALKFLTDPELRAKSAHKGIYDELAANAKENLLRIPAVKYENRNETVAMLGFRHITGIMKWPSFHKARFIHNFVQNNLDLTFSETARILGDDTSVVRRNYATYRIYLQICDLDVDTTNLVKEFSIFFTALGRLSFQGFLGVRIRGSTIKGLEKPVPENHLAQLEELVKWIHGSEDVKAIVPESRDLKYLAAVVESSDALTFIRSGGKLSDAYSLTISEEESVIDSINKASFHIEESLRFLHRHRNNPNISNAISRCAQSLKQALTHFPEVLAEVFGESG